MHAPTPMKSPTYAKRFGGQAYRTSQTCEASEGEFRYPLKFTGAFLIFHSCKCAVIIGVPECEAHPARHFIVGCMLIQLFLWREMH